MDLFFAMSPVAAAALHIGILIFLMLQLKGFVGMHRYKHKAASGELPNPDFARMSRVQMNAVEDVPPLMVGLLALAILGMPAWYIHLAGSVLIASRILHAVGLATAGGRGFGRFWGTMGTIAVYIAVGGALIMHAFTPAH